MNDKKVSLIYIICAFILTVVIFLSTILFTAMDASFYHNEHLKLDTPAYSGLTIDQLDDAMDLLLRYINGEAKSLDIAMQDQYTKEWFELFNKKEKDHMVDVRNLYQMVLYITTISAFVFVALSFFLLISRKKLALLGFSFYFNRVSLIIAILVGVILSIAFFNFDFFWTNFHHLVFSNDLWLLDPFTDRLITIVHAEVFFDLVVKIALRFALVFGGLNIICYFYQKLFNRKLEVETI